VYFEILLTLKKMMILESGDCGLAHDSGVLLDVISAHMQESPVYVRANREKFKS
jgi:hypothetical protein